MHDRGVIVVASDPYGNTPRRPYLLLSDETHPFAGRQYIALGITTAEYADARPLEGEFEAGALDRESFVSPWAVVSLRDRDIDRAVARVSEDFVHTVIDDLMTYVSL